ncbi:hypothetical protein [Microbulbifer epialgicus]|uniref:Uncharacterized protein n=1 Tax=Microbulbifer epialgicus TaxID=393907 RepID=A0ABV4NUB5_9GAMM
MSNVLEQGRVQTIGWLGCVPVIPNDDPDIVRIRTQFEWGTGSTEMQNATSFDAWIRSCTEISSEIILKMMNTVDPGETPPKSDVICKQIHNAQRTCAMKKSHGLC